MKMSRANLMISTFLLLLVVTIIFFIRFVNVSPSPSSAPQKRIVGKPAKVLPPAATDIVCTAADHKEQLETTSKPNIILCVDFPDYYVLEGASGTRIFESCKESCELTVNSSRLSEASVVVFFAHKGIKRGYNSNPVPPKKLPGQVWVYFAVESPAHPPNHGFTDPAWQRLFNWTVTYRHDSDFWHGYITVTRRTAVVPAEVRTEEEKKWRGIFSQKTKMVAWFVSNCNTESKREYYVAELSKYIPVDIYGRCGTLKCDDRKLCYDMLVRDYKFYLSFENSLCKEYVTEKTSNILGLDGVIPVVRGGHGFRKNLPANSVIDASEFSSPKELASHLKSLADDEDAYIQMLKWRWEYKVKGASGFPLCDLCRRSYQHHTVSCYYEDVHAWWTQNACHTPTDL